MHSPWANRPLSELGHEVIWRMSAPVRLIGDDVGAIGTVQFRTAAIEDGQNPCLGPGATQLILLAFSRA
jgi:hypothetical protein